MELFHDVRPNGGTPLGQKLDMLLTAYLERLDEQRESIKPVNYIVITDGAPSWSFIPSLPPIAIISLHSR